MDFLTERCPQGFKHQTQQGIHSFLYSIRKARNGQEWIPRTIA